MKRTNKIWVVLWMFLFFIHYSSIAQTAKIEDAERRLVKQYSTVLNALGNGNPDSVNYYSDKFSEGLLNLIKRNPVTLSYNFKILTDSQYCFINTSADYNFRIYSWDTWTGGTMHNFDEIFQYKSNGQVFSKLPKSEEGDPGNFCSKIYTVAMRNKVYYLAITNGIYSTKDVSQSISVFMINNNKLIDTVKLFKAKTKLLSRIDVSYDLFSVADSSERPAGLITYDVRLKIIYIPVVNGKGTVTDKNLLYQLKGNYFEFIGTEKGKRKQ